MGSDQSKNPSVPPLSAQEKHGVLKARQLRYTHSFSCSPARPCGPFHKSFMDRIMCVTEDVNQVCSLFSFVQIFGIKGESLFIVIHSSRSSENIQPL